MMFLYVFTEAAGERFIDFGKFQVGVLLGG